jgi:hypothetical protein
MLRPPIERWNTTAELRPLLGGHRNLAYRTVGLDTDFVFKSTKRTPAGIAWLRQVHQVARQSGFVVPFLQHSSRGQLVEEGWTCETFIEGQYLPPEGLSSLLPLITRFHEATERLPQRPGFRSSQELLIHAVGGDVSLDKMPRGLVSKCRDAWLAVADRHESVIHGDLNHSNTLRCLDGRIALIDWDECRRDLLLFDLGPLREGDDREQSARIAWEVACSWLIEPEHARQVARRL